MRDPASALVRKLWQYCNVLRDDGLSYPDYVEQLTYLLFLKMSDEQENGPVPREFAWSSLVNLDAEAMNHHYGHVLNRLSEHGGMLGLIFRNARNKVKDPVKLRFLIRDLIGQTEWTGLSRDVKGDAYEGLLEKNARDTKSGAGQYFTPRPLIEAIVACVNPQLGEVVCDPACGTGGFLLAAYDHLLTQADNLSEVERSNGISSAVHGVELVEEVARLAAMNLLLHGVTSQEADGLPITCADSLKELPTALVDVVLTNPPFGVKGSVTYSAKDRSIQRGSDELKIARPDFWVQTANKQLNFLQHCFALLKSGGRAAVIVPDNVLFEGGAAATIRRRLIETCDVHTLLRLPTGLFYAQGVKANVLFFDRGTDHSSNDSSQASLWVYDLRSDYHFTLKTRPLGREDLNEFIHLYCAKDRNKRQALYEASGLSSRWRPFNTMEILKSVDCSLDLMRDAQHLVDEQVGLSRLDELSRQISDDLRQALIHVSNFSDQQ